MILPKIVFATTPAAGGDDREAVLLANSLRRNGGRMADCPFWVMVAESTPLRQNTAAALAKARAHCIPYVVPEPASGFPFAHKVFAAGAAEEKAQAGGYDLLVWMDPDTLILREPREFILENTRQLGCRPVHLTLMSSLFDQPLDEFWGAIYRECGVIESNVFPIKTVVDHQYIRPNFNAGLMVVRPRLGLLQTWARHFENLYQDPFFKSFYDRNALYRIFIHQCVLAGSILEKLAQDQIRDFSSGLNYPLHIHNKMPDDVRADSWNRLVTVRYDSLDFFEHPNWQGMLQINEPLLGWMMALLGSLKN